MTVHNKGESASYLGVHISMYPTWRKENVHKKSSQQLSRRSSRTHHDALNRRPPRHLLAILLAIWLRLRSAMRGALSFPSRGAQILLLPRLLWPARESSPFSRVHYARKFFSPIQLLPPLTLPIYFWSPRNQDLILFSSFLFPSLFLHSLYSYSYGS